MSKQADTKALDVVLSLAAAWLAFRGEDPKVIGERAQAAATTFENARRKLEDFAVQQINAVVNQDEWVFDCRGTKSCNCKVCREKRTEDRTRRAAEQRQSRGRAS